MTSNVGSKKKQELLIVKEKLLKELEYYDKRIKDVGVNNNNLLDEDSSDSDTGLPRFSLDIGPSIAQLKLQKSKLRTCFQASQELTSLKILQSQVNIMVEDPVFDGEPVTEAGTWREVTAECRIHHLPFSIMFYVHKPSDMFGPVTYRGLRVSALKAAHEAELGASVLSNIRTPADALQVLRSYMVAYRSRRETLAKLAERYGDTLYMEPNDEGGFVLKCAGLLEVWWRVENTRSPLVDFRHNMKINVEHMDECYVKIIAHANKDISKPGIDTEERTFLLAKIITTCLEVRGSTQELYESMESGTESVNIFEKRQTTHAKETKTPEETRKGEANIMAPPNYLPKKAKPKGKENTVENCSKGVKRTSSNDRIDGKRAKIGNEGNIKRINNQKVAQSDEKTKKTDKKVIGGSESLTITDLVYKGNAADRNIDKTKTKKVIEKKNVDENTANDVEKVTKKVKATVNDPISTKSKVTKDNLDTKDPKDKENENTANLPKESVTANQNANSKETAITIAKNKELNIGGTCKKQKSQENNNTKKSTSNKNTVKQNKNLVPINGETTSNIAKMPKIGSKIPEHTNMDSKNDNAENNLGKKKETVIKAKNQNAESIKGVASTKKSKATDKKLENKNYIDENEKNELLQKSKSDNANKLKTVVTKTKVNQDNAKNNEALDYIEAKKDDGDGTKTTVNKNNEPNIAKINEKKSVASAKDKTSTNVLSKNKEINIGQKVTENTDASSENTDNNTVKKTTLSNAATNKKEDNIVDIATGNVASLSKEGSKDNTQKTVQNKQISVFNNNKKHTMSKLIAKPGSSGTFMNSGSTGTFLKPGSTEKKDGGKITSKIPQKTMKTLSEIAMKKIVKRISPRKMSSMFNGSSRPISSGKIQKPTTNIPRLLKKSDTKTKS